MEEPAGGTSGSDLRWSHDPSEVWRRPAAALVMEEASAWRRSSHVGNVMSHRERDEKEPTRLTEWV